MATGIVTDAFIGAVRDRLPDLRLLTDATDRDSYRRDETAYLPSGLPGVVAGFPLPQGDGRSRYASRPHTPAGRPPPPTEDMRPNGIAARPRWTWWTRGADAGR